MRTTTVAASAGNLFQLIRSGAATTRPELTRLTGLSRSAVGQRVSALIAAGLVTESEPVASTGGRPPTRLRFTAESGLVLAADLGVTHCRIAVSTLDGSPLAELAAEKPIALGPDVILEWLVERVVDLVAEAGRDAGDIRGIGIGVPGPVEFSAGRAVQPPIMPGWDGVPIPARLHPRFPVPILVDNDVNIMAVGEYGAHWSDTADDLLFVKVGTGIGCGIVVGGDIHRGAQGAAGDIGHIEVQGHQDVRCHCGNTGCVEAVAGGEALAHRLRDLGYDCPDARGVTRLVRGGNADAIRLVRDAGRSIGEVLAGLVNAFNPAVIVVGGDIAEAHTPLLAGVREVIYRRSTALATRGLELVASRLGDRAGVVGAITTVLDHILATEAIDAVVATSSSTASPTAAGGAP
jgi:predicted NBD/HSP70 family sugar kinase